MYVRAYNSPPPPQLRGPTLRGLQWHTLALFFSRSHSRARREEEEEEEGA